MKMLFLLGPFPTRRDVFPALIFQKKSRISEDIVTFNALLAACEKALEWQQALAVLQSLVQRQLRPEAISINAAIRALAKQKIGWYLQVQWFSHHFCLWNCYKLE